MAVAQAGVERGIAGRDCRALDRRLRRRFRPNPSGRASIPTSTSIAASEVSGTFEHADEALVFRPQGQGAAAGEGPGYLVLTPLRLASGAHVIVDRGFVPVRLREAGHARGRPGRGRGDRHGPDARPESRNPFTPGDDPAHGQWYTRDPQAIAAHFDLPRAAPFTVDADETPAPGGWPKGGQALLAIANDHLSYALTWYGLAATLAGVFGVHLWNTRRRRAPGEKAGRHGR